MDTAFHQAIQDMISSRINISVLFNEEAILEFTTLDISIRTDFRVLSGGFNSHNYTLTQRLKINNLDKLGDNKYDNKI